MPSPPWLGDEDGSAEAPARTNRAAPGPQAQRPKKMSNPERMKAYEVQFELPVDNPVNSVRVKRGKKRWIFYVPINHPLAHNIGLQELVQAAERAKLLGLSTDLNNSVDSVQKKTSN